MESEGNFPVVEKRKNCVKLFLDNMSAGVLTTPGICCNTILMSKVAAKNHKDLRRCITVLSLE